MLGIIRRKSRKVCGLGMVLTVFNLMIFLTLYNIGYIDENNTFKLDLDFSDRYLEFRKYAFSLFQSNINIKLSEMISTDYKGLDEETISQTQDPNFEFKDYYNGLKVDGSHSKNDIKNLALVSFYYRTDYTKFVGFREKLLNPLIELFKQHDPSKKISSLNRLYLNYLLNAYYYNLENSPILTEDYLQSIITLTPRQQSILTSQHESILDQLSNFEYPNEYYIENSKGIVFVSGDNYNWLTYLSILNLREKGCTLPIEIIIPNLKDYNLTYCERIYPQLNVKCLLMSEYFPTGSNLKLNGFQFKSLALLLSSFETVLLLDSDNIALTDPTYIFDSIVCKSSGMIVWPDYWKRTTSPFFYRISGVQIGDERVRDFLDPYLRLTNQPEDFEPEVPFHDMKNTIPNPTSESGQLLLNKRTHFKTLLLSFYYNLYGPNFYYALLTQGVAGEGDKETFIGAAHVVNESYYQVKKNINSIGYADNGYMNVIAMGQYDPVADYEIAIKLEKMLEDDLKYKDYKDVQVYNVNSPAPMISHNMPDLLFVHANHPKLQPVNLIKNKRYFNSNNERMRLFQNIAKTHENDQSDFELTQWMFFKKMLCDLRLTFNELGSFDRTEVCHEIDEHLLFLRDHPLL